ncbi:unnamed protein product [Camellia sinensis]
MLLEVLWRKLQTPLALPIVLLQVAVEVEREEGECGTAIETFTDYMMGQDHSMKAVTKKNLYGLYIYSQCNIYKAGQKKVAFKYLTYKMQPPESTYDLIIKDDLESSQALSCLQIETLVYAYMSSTFQMVLGQFFYRRWSWCGQRTNNCRVDLRELAPWEEESISSENAFKGILTSLPKAGGGEFGKFYSLPALNDPRIGYAS